MRNQKWYCAGWENFLSTFSQDGFPGTKLHNDPPGQQMMMAKTLKVSVKNKKSSAQAIV